MTIKKITYISSFLIISCLFLTSCEKFIFVDLAEREKLLVLHSVITPDNQISARVSHSLSTFSEEEYQEITNASVVITSQNSSDTLLYYNGLYIGDVQPVINEEYQISVEADGYTNISANDKIPQKIVPISLDTMAGYHNGETTQDFEFRFNNQAGKQDFIIIELLVNEVWEGGSSSDYWPQYIYSDDLVIENSTNNDYGVRRLLLSDKNIDGQEYTLRFYVPDYFYYTAEFKLKVYSCSENYFKYIKTYDKYEESNGDFFSQPVQVFSNIENGIGIFGAYSVDEIEL